MLAAFRRALSFGLRSGLASCGALASVGLFRSRLVKFRRSGLPGFVEFLTGRLHGRNVAALERFLHLVKGGFNFAAVIAGHLLLVVLQQSLRAIHRAVGLVARLQVFLALPVLFSMEFAVLAHFLDLVLGEAAAGRDGDLLFLARAEILGADMQDAIGINVEADFDLRHPTRSGRNVIELELADGLAVAGKLAFTLQDMDLHGRLIVGGRAESLVTQFALDYAKSHTS